MADASRRFVRRDQFEPNTRLAYTRTLDALATAVGADTTVDTVNTYQLEDLLTDRWGTAAATTYNRHRVALLSFFGWCGERGWTRRNPASFTEPRKVRRRTEDERRDRPISPDQLTDLWLLDRVAVRDRLLWRMAYETWGRADELLGLDLADLDLGKREAIVHGKGGDREAVWWATGTARLLPKVTAGRRKGPLFIAARLPTRPMPTADIDPVTGRARLAYRQAERLFTATGRRIDPDGIGWTLHRLRHSGIAHAVEAGWNLAQIRAKSRHTSLRSLEVYANPSVEAVRAMTEALDPHNRRH